MYIKMTVIIIPFFATIITGCTSSSTQIKPTQRTNFIQKSAIEKQAAILETKSVVSITSECIQWGPFEICDPINSPQSSLVWRIFDSSNENRQNQILQKMIINADWEAKNVQPLSPRSETSFAWNRKVQHVLNRAATDVHAQGLQDIFLGNELYNLMNKKLKPAIKIHLKTNKAQVDREAAMAWIKSAINTNVAQSFCQYQNTSNTEQCAREIYKEIIPANMEAQLNHLLRDNVGNLKSMANQIFQTAYFFNDSKNNLNKNTRKVYIINQESSPRVDILGNLYISQHHLRSLTPDEIDIIFSHEATHVYNFTNDQLSAIFKDLEKLVEQKTIDDDYMEKFLLIMRHPDEAFIDQKSIELFDMNYDKISKYAKLVLNLEKNDRSRSNMLSYLSKIRGYMPLHQISSRISDVYIRRCGGANSGGTNIPPFWENSVIFDTLVKYNTQYIEYQSQRLANYISYIDQNEKLKITIKDIKNQLKNNGCITIDIKHEKQFIRITSGSLGIN